MGTTTPSTATYPASGCGYLSIKHLTRHLVPPSGIPTRIEGASAAASPLRQAPPQQTSQPPDDAIAEPGPAGLWRARCRSARLTPGSHAGADEHRSRAFDAIAATNWLNKPIRQLITVGRDDRQSGKGGGGHATRRPDTAKNPVVLTRSLDNISGHASQVCPQACLAGFFPPPSEISFQEDPERTLQQRASKYRPNCIPGRAYSAYPNACLIATP
jgi:hypothetical protein